MLFVCRNTKIFTRSGSRYYSQKNEEWKACSNLPLSLSWSSLRTRLEGGTESKSQFPNFGGIVKYSEEGQTNIRQTQSVTPLGKLMEDKQASINSDVNHMVSLDPNTSMWQNLDSTTDKTNAIIERKAEMCNSIHQFYSKRCEAEQKIKGPNPTDEASAGTGSKVSLYSQISRRRYMGNPNVYHPNAMMNQEEDDYERMNQRMGGDARRAGGNRADNPRGAYERRQMEGGYDMRRREPNDRMIDTRFQNRPLQQLTRSSTNVNVLDRKSGKGGGMRRSREDVNQDEQTQEMKEFAVYDDSAPYATPIYSTGRCAEESGSVTSSSRRLRSTDDSDKRSDKYSNKYNQSEDYEYKGNSYTAVNPPEPMFKQSAGVASTKMRFFDGNNSAPNYNKGSTL